MKHYKLLPDVNKKHYAQLSDACSTWARVKQGENGSYGIRREDVNNWKESNKCDISLGTLFLLFLDFYANVIDFQEHRLVIEDGSLRSKRRCNPTHRIMIQDVIDSDNPAKSVKEEGMFVHWLENAMEIVMETPPKEIFDRLMRDKLKDIFTYSKEEINELRQEGLHASPFPPPVYH